MLDSSKVMFAINLKEYIKYTRIKADYLCEYDVDDARCLYLFMVKEKQTNDEKQYKLCSFFKKGDKDYRRGTANTTILLNIKKEKLDDGSIVSRELYRNPRYIEGTKTP